MATAPTSPNETQTRTSSLRRLGSAVRRRKARVGEQAPASESTGAGTQAFTRLQQQGSSLSRTRPVEEGAGPQPVPTNGKPQAGAKMKEGATGSDTGAGRKPTAEPQTADPFRAAGTTPEGLQLYRSESGRMVYRDAGGQLRPYEEGVGDFMGSVDPETGQVEAAAIGEYGQKQLKKLEGLAETETAAAEESLQEAETAIGGREADTERLLAEGRERLDATVQAADDIAEQAKQDVGQLPGQVQGALEGIADKYKETTDIDIDRIEGLGRAAVGMAMEGKNAAAQAAVSAQQQAMRDAEAKINADPNISAGRKSALLAQLRVNGSMQIATTIGANIKDFTKMQVGAMTDTMNAVGTALSQRSAGLATMGAAEVSAVAGAYDTAAKISSGFDELRIQTRNNIDSIRFNYDNLTANYRDAKDGTSLALLDANNYVSQLPYDFEMNHTAVGMNILGQDFAMKLQAGGYNNLMEAAADGQDWARDAMLSQLFMTAVGGPVGTALGALPMLDDLWEAIFGGK